MAPGPLREAAGIHYQEFSNLAAPLALRGDPLQAGAQNQVSDWAEMLLPDTAAPVAFYDHPFFGKYPAITENHFGKGMVTYEGTVLSAALQQKVLARVLRTGGPGRAGSETPRRRAHQTRRQPRRQGDSLLLQFLWRRRRARPTPTPAARSCWRTARCPPPPRWLLNRGALPSSKKSNRAKSAAHFEPRRPSCYPKTRRPQGTLQPRPDARAERWPSG
jgi:hypothetical protein